MIDLLDYAFEEFRQPFVLSEKTLSRTFWAHNPWGGNAPTSEVPRVPPYGVYFPSKYSQRIQPRSGYFTPLIKDYATSLVDSGNSFCPLWQTQFFLLVSSSH